MAELSPCPVCGQPMPEESAMNRLCSSCGMPIAESGTYFAVAGSPGLRFLCSPRCVRSYVALGATKGRSQVA